MLDFHKNFRECSFHRYIWVSGFLSSKNYLLCHFFIKKNLENSDFYLVPSTRAVPINFPTPTATPTNKSRPNQSLRPKSLDMNQAHYSWHLCGVDRLKKNFISLQNLQAYVRIRAISFCGPELRVVLRRLIFP